MTLMELVVVIVVMGVVSITTVPFFRVNVDSYISVRGGKDALQSARIGYNRMMNEIKMLEASLDIDNGYSNKFQFDLPHQSNINYTYESGTLTREGQVLVSGVRSFVVKYYKEDGSLKNTPFFYDSDVWRIKIEMEVGDGTDNFYLQGQVSPRNVHFN